MQSFKKNLKEVLLLVFLLVFYLVAVSACSSKSKVEYKEVYLSVPMKCDFNLIKPVEIDTSSLQGKLESLTLLSLDGKELRQKIKQIPCLNITEKD